MLKYKKLLPSVLICGITLGTAWAVRGQFGHTQGAAWAGAFCALIIILLSNRADWLKSAFTLSCACSLGWGVGGIISYGLVVAYGQGLDFPNVYYGQVMLFFIGSLFGFLGGGLFALALSNTQQQRVNWWLLTAQMLAGGVVVHLLLVKIIGLRMTPPRGDGWAACLGMALVLWRYFRCKGFSSAQRVALLGALGAGWGFAFGNFLRVTGISTGIAFHHWNVMEYSIGFFGGSAVAYAVFTSHWPQKTDGETAALPHATRLAALLVLAGLIPLVLWQQSFTAERLARMLQDSGLGIECSAWITFIQALVLAGITVSAVFTLKIYGKKNPPAHLPTPQADAACKRLYRDIWRFFVFYMLAFIGLSFLITGAFFSAHRIEQYLYPLNLIVILLLVGKVRAPFTARSLDLRCFLAVVLLALLVLAALGYAAIHMHGELWGAQKRFP